MPIRLPGVSGVPLTPQGVPQGRAPVPDQSQQIGGQQLREAGVGIQRTGAQLAGLGQQLADHANDARSSQQATLHGVELDKLVSGYEQQLTADASTGYKPLLEQIEKLQGQFSGQLENATQRDLYKRRVQAQVAQVRGRVERHYARQTRAWNIEQTEVSLNEFAREYQTAAQLGDADDEERSHRMGVARAAMESQFRKLASLSGLDADTAEAKKREQLAKLHADTLDALVDSASAEQARDYFGEFQGEMDPKTRARAKRALDAADLKDRALAKARKFAEAAGADASADERLQAVMDRAAKITNADEFAAVMSYAEAEHRRGVRMEAARRNNLINEVEAAVRGEGGEFLTFEQMPPSLQAQLREEGLEQEARALFGARDRVTDNRVFLPIMANPDLLRGVSPEQFEREIKPALSDKDWEKARGQWARANGTGGASPSVSAYLDSLDAFAEVMRQGGFSALFGRNGITDTAVAKNPDLAARAKAYELEFQRMIERGAITKDMPYDQKVKTLRQALFGKMATVPGWFSDTKVSTVEMDPESGFTVTNPLTGESEFVKITAVPGTGPDGRVAGEFGVHGTIAGLMVEAGQDPSPEMVMRRWLGLGKPETRAEVLDRMRDPNYGPDAVRAAASPLGQVLRRIGSDGANTAGVMRALANPPPAGDNLTTAEKWARVREMLNQK